MMVSQVRLQEGTPERLRKTRLYAVASPRDRRAPRGNLRVGDGRKQERGKARPGLASWDNLSRLLAIGVVASSVRSGPGMVTNEDYCFLECMQEPDRGGMALSGLVCLSKAFLLSPCSL